MNSPVVASWCRWAAVRVLSFVRLFLRFAGPVSWWIASYFADTEMNGGKGMHACMRVSMYYLNFRKAHNYATRDIIVVVVVVVVVVVAVASGTCYFFVSQDGLSTSLF